MPDNVRRRRALPIILTPIGYLLDDEFSDTRAAGAVNGTTATPIGGVRTVIDTNSKISLANGVLSFAAGEAANDGVWYPIQTRIAGKTLFFQITPGNVGVRVGLDSDQSGALVDSLSFGSSSTMTAVLNASVSPVVGTFAAATAYYVAWVMRSAGELLFIKGGAFSNWTLLYPSVGGTANLYPGINTSTTGVAMLDFVRIPQSLVSIPTLASDAFTRDDGALGVTGPASYGEPGGIGLTWTAQKGTWGVATNKAACSALADSVGIATVNAGTTNVVSEAVVTRTGGTSGLVLRYQSETNYIKATHDGTNAAVIEVVDGTPNTLLTAALAYGATKRFIVSLSGTEVRAWYGDAAVGTTATTAIATGNNHGLFTDDTGATFDVFVVWAKGAGGEYDNLFNKYSF